MLHRRRLVTRPRRRNSTRSRRELARAHAQLSQLYNQLREAEDARERYTNLLVHDIRSPLMATHAGIEIIRRVLSGQQMPEFVEEALNSSLRSLRSVVELTNDLLNIKRLQSGFQEIRHDPVMLAGLCADTCLLMQPLAREQRLTLCRLVEPADLHVYGDLRLLQRVLMNLLSNAIRLTPEGGVITVEAHPSFDGNAILLSVDDMGPGIPEADRERIFHPFVQARSHGHGGAGLGLTFCREVVQAHSGRIWVEERPGGGARFCLELPLS